MTVVQTCALPIWGLALAWAGAQTCANLRMAGHLSGGMENDEALDRVLVPRPIHIRDYF